MAKQALTALRQVNPRVVGALLNRMPTRGTGYYYYDHYYGSGDSNGPPDAPARKRRKRQEHLHHQPNQDTPEW